MSEVLHLTVEARVYTLDELKDLESKLVLITEYKDEGSMKVDEFLTVSVLCFNCGLSCFKNMLINLVDACLNSLGTLECVVHNTILQ